MALRVRLDVDPATRRKVDKLNPQALNQALLEGGRRFQTYALRQLPRHTQAKTRTRTGTLARSWRTAQPSPSEITFSNIATSSGPKRTPIAAFLEHGTRDHPVAPVRKKALRWRTGGRGPVSAFRAGPALASGNFAFSKGHRVSGIKPRRIFLGFWKRARRKFGQFFGEALDETLTAR